MYHTIGQKGPIGDNRMPYPIALLAPTDQFTGKAKNPSHRMNRWEEQSVEYVACSSSLRRNGEKEYREKCQKGKS